MKKIIFNGKFYLGRESFCQAVVIENGRIARTGSTVELLEQAPGAEKIDAEGALVLPAFNDSHLHLMWMGRREGGVEAAGSKSLQEVINRGRELIQKLKPSPSSYILGDGVNPDLFTIGEKRDLHRQDLDQISMDLPVILRRHCGHIVYCNSLALKIAGLSESAPEIQGGTIDVDENGKPTGVLRENAGDLVWQGVPDPSKEESKSFLRLAMNKAHSLGISACASNDSSGEDFESVLGAYTDVFNEEREQGRPALRVNMQCSVSGREDMLELLLSRSREPLWADPAWGAFLKIGSLKLFIDGSLGGQTAWMRRPYRDKPETLGVPVLDQQTLNRFVEKSARSGLQVLVHAIGDAGMDAVISAYEKVTEPGKNPLRHGIIHCQITTPDILERMANRQILAIVQPVFLMDDIYILESRVGPGLASTSYAWASMERLGIPVSYSTDASVSPLNPLLNIEWAVLRRDSENPSSAVFCPQEQVDVFTAVDAYTAGSAFAGFEENSLGRIASGFLADLVFLDRDIFTIPPEEIHKARVLRTMCAGESVYEL